jgi:hypothetical protein
MNGGVKSDAEIATCKCTSTISARRRNQRERRRGLDPPSLRRHEGQRVSDEAASQVARSGCRSKSSAGFEPLIERLSAERFTTVLTGQKN